METLLIALPQMFAFNFISLHRKSYDETDLFSHHTFCDLFNNLFNTNVSYGCQQLVCNLVTNYDDKNQCFNLTHIMTFSIGLLKYFFSIRHHLHLMETL